MEGLVLYIYYFSMAVLLGGGENVCFSGKIIMPPSTMILITWASQSLDINANEIKTIKVNTNNKFKVVKNTFSTIKFYEKMFVLNFS